MRVGQVSAYISLNPTFGITTKKPHRDYYSGNSHNKILGGKFEDFTFMQIDHRHGRFNSTLVVLRKLGHWIKSKIGYTDRDGNRQLNRL